MHRDPASEVIKRHPRRGFLTRQSSSESVWAYLLVSPMLIGFTLFFIVALGASLVLSFTEWRMIDSPQWVGPANYRELARDPEFRTALTNTIAITIPYVVLRLAISLAIAVALNSGIRFQTFYRLVFFLPVVTMPVAIGTIWKWLYDPMFGPINATLRQLGLPQPEWLTGRWTAVIAVVIVLLWSGIGFDMIIFLAGLQTIPRTYYEAASLDGATGWRQFRDITLPLLTPTTFFLSVVGVIYSLQVFDLVYVMTRIDQTNRLPTVVYFIYDQGFRSFRMGYAIAIGWVLLVMILIFTVIQFRLQKRWVVYA